MVDRKASQVFVVDDVLHNGDSIVWDAALGQWKPGAVGGGGSASTLVDATSGGVSLTADDDALTISDDIDFVSHGKLDTDHGFTPTDGEGRLPTWYDPANTQFDQGGWFAFGYDNTIGRVAQHWGSGATEGVNVIADEAFTRVNVFVNPAQTDTQDQSVFSVWRDAGDTFPLVDIAVVNYGALIGGWSPNGARGWFSVYDTSNDLAGDLVVVAAGSSTPLMLDAGYGTIITLPAAAIPNAELAAAEQNWGSAEGAVQAYLDAAGNKLKFRVVYADGTTFKTGEVALA